MNNTIYKLGNWFSNNFPKVIKLIIENKKWIYIWYFSIFGLLFVIPFCLYLVSGIGIHFENLEGGGEAPSFNGVWFLDDYVGNSSKELLQVQIPNWTYLQHAFNNTGFENSNNFASLAYQFYLMNKAVLPIWITGLVFIVVPLLVYVLFKYLINPWVKKNLEKLNNSDNMNNN